MNRAIGGTSWSAMAKVAGLEPGADITSRLKLHISGDASAGSSAFGGDGSGMVITKYGINKPRYQRRSWSPWFSRIVERRRLLKKLHSMYAAQANDFYMQNYWGTWDNPFSDSQGIHPPPA